MQKSFIALILLFNFCNALSASSDHAVSVSRFNQDPFLPDPYVSGQSILDLESWSEFDQITKITGITNFKSVLIALDLEDTIAKCSLRTTLKAKNSLYSEDVTFEHLASPEFRRLNLRTVRESLTSWGQEHKLNIRDVMQIRSNLCLLKSNIHYEEAEEGLYKILRDLKDQGAVIEIFSGHGDLEHYLSHEPRAKFLETLNYRLGITVPIYSINGAHLKIKRVSNRAKDLKAPATLFIDNFINQYTTGFMRGAPLPDNFHLVRYKGVSKYATISAIRNELSIAKRFGLHLKSNHDDADSKRVDHLDASPRYGEEFSVLPSIIQSDQERFERHINSFAFEELSALDRKKIIEYAVEQWKKDRL